MFDFVSKRKWFYLISALVIVPGIISMIIQGLNIGIEFSSGASQTIVFQQPVAQADLVTALADLNHADAVVQRSVKDAYSLEGRTLSSAEKESLISGLQADFGSLRIADFSTENEGSFGLIFDEKPVEAVLERGLDSLGFDDFTLQSRMFDSFLVRTKALATGDQDEAIVIQESLTQRFGAMSVLDFFLVSPLVASERVSNTGIAIAVAAAAMILYIAWAFRKLIHSFRYGVCAVIALLHDILVVLGVFSLFQLQVDSTLILAVLTVIGYSVNNTIVVFDRIRENVTRRPGAKFESVVNVSLTEVLTRSLNTSLTTLFALIAVFLFGGPTIQNFVLALIIGIVSGTYSAIFNASQLVVSWERGELWRFLRLSWLPFHKSSPSPKGDTP